MGLACVGIIHYMIMVKQDVVESCEDFFFSCSFVSLSRKRRKGAVVHFPTFVSCLSVHLNASGVVHAPWSRGS